MTDVIRPRTADERMAYVQGASAMLNDIRSMGVERAAQVWLPIFRATAEEPEYRCEYCGGPSDLPQVCADCGEGA